MNINLTINNMKTKISILVALIGLILITTECWAQTPPKQYQPPGDAKVTVTLTIPAAFLNAYIYTVSNGGVDGISHSNQLSAAQATEVLSGYKTALDSLYQSGGRAYNKFYTVGHDKWAADTLVIFKAKKLPVKK